MGRNWKITPEQARIFVDELIDQISQSDMDLPELFRDRTKEHPRYPHSWPQFFRAMADALELNK